MRKMMLFLGGVACGRSLGSGLPKDCLRRESYRERRGCGGTVFHSLCGEDTQVPHGESFEKKSLSVVASPGEVGFKISVKKGDIVLGTKELQVSLDTSTGVLSYETADGTPLLREKVWKNSLPPLTMQVMQLIVFTRLSNWIPMRLFTGWDSYKTGRCPNVGK